MSEHSTKTKGLLGASILVLASSCSTHAGARHGGGPTNEALIGGEYTLERPEVGSIDGCTATLVGERLVVTAAHCVEFTPETTPGHYNTFVIDTGGSATTYDVDLVAVFGSMAGENDVALLHLATPVPASIAAPAPIGRAMPPADEVVSTYGYGCQERESMGGDFRKQRLDHVLGEATHNLCPGDSGGPTFSADGHVLLVNSAYYLDDGTDLYGDVVASADLVAMQAAAWGEALADDASAAPSPADPGAAPMDPGAPPADPGATPSDPGAPMDPGAPPADPGAAPADPGAAAPTCTCVDGVSFACSTGFTLDCPDGSACLPGSTELACPFSDDV